MRLKDRTAKYVAQEVSHAETELTNLASMREELNAQYEAVQLKLEALKKALGPDYDYVDLALQLVNGKSAVDANAVTGFRHSVRTAVAHGAGKGLTTREVWEFMKHAGFKYTGTSDPVNRTGNELRRLVEKGELRRYRNKFYPAIAKEVGGASQEGTIQ